MRATKLWRMPLGATMCLGLLIGCGPIAFQDTINFATPAPTPTPTPVVAEAPKPARAKIEGDQIKIDDKIQFDYNSANIKSESHSLLDEVATVLKDHPEIERLEIVGHTSSEGSDSLNEKLSKDRAAAVMNYLVEQGIAAERLSSQGKGEKDPVATNDTDEGKEQNRRVEFKIKPKGGARAKPGGSII